MKQKLMRQAIRTLLVCAVVFLSAMSVQADQGVETCADFQNKYGGTCPNTCECPDGENWINCHLMCFPEGGGYYDVYCSTGGCYYEQ